MSIPIHGTNQPAAFWRTIRAGPLSFELEEGAVRYVRLNGVEVLRGIAFLVRDADWRTVAAKFDEVSVERHGDTATISYRATAAMAGGAIVWRAAIMADATGLVFHAEGAATATLTVNRVGFVVLHPPEGLAGCDVEVEHTDGTRETVRVPAAISPGQPVTDVAAITHTAAPGLTASVSLFGDAFEMEDQRNWTDASFKTYARPLAQQHPFELAADTPIAQSVRLTTTGAATPPNNASGMTVEIGAAEGSMPDIALAVDASELHAAASVAELAPSQVWLRLDCADPQLPAALAEARSLGLGRRLTLDLVIDGCDPDRELAEVSRAGLDPARVVVVLRRDLEARLTSAPRPGEVGVEAVAQATRAAFPAAKVGGGVRANFAELNRNWPHLAGVDIVAHSTSATVHAADDRSVMETLEGLVQVVASVRAMAPDALYHLGPCTIGMAENPYAPILTANPDLSRTVGARLDPRHFALFGAAWGVGVLDVAARGGVAALSLGYATGDLALTKPPITPLGLVAKMAATAASRLRLRTVPVAGLASVAWTGPRGPDMLLANLTGTSRGIVGLAAPASLLAELAHGWGWGEPSLGALVLGPYAVARVVH